MKKKDLLLDSDIAEIVEGGSRHPKDFGRWLIPLLAGCWSIFQLLVANHLLLDSLTIRSVHLSFALSLTYLSHPLLKGGGHRRGFFSFAYAKERIPFVDLLLAILAGGTALYLALFQEEIGNRQGMPSWYDVVIGSVLVLLLLEGARRMVGLALPIISSIFILSSLFASSLPSFLASKAVTLSHLISKLTLSTEGIYGLPLRISADTVFLFVLFGALLDTAGGGKYFVDIAFSLLGRFRGGPAKAAVLASGLTGMVSGSSIANTVTTGTFTIPLMKRCGYPAEKAAAIEVAASTNGQLMPPIMGAAAFIIAEYCNLPYLDVVRAAFLPAFVSYLTLFYLTHLEARKLSLKPVPADQLKKFFPLFVSGLHFLIPIAILLYHLIIRRHTPNLSAYYSILSVAAIMTTRNLLVERKHGFKVSFILWNTVRQMWSSLVAGATNMISIGVAVALAGIVIGNVSLGLGGKITEIVHVISGGHILPLLFITAVVSLILGMGLPTTANYIIMANLTVPAIVHLTTDAGFHTPLIAAHLFCFYFGILADDTPPVALAATAASAIARSDPLRTGMQGFLYDIRTALLPFMFIFNEKLLLIGVSGWWEIMFMFVTATAAMFAFASITQQFIRFKLRFYEFLLLMVAIACLMQPSYLQGWYEMKWVEVWGFIGLAIYGSVYLSHRNCSIRQKLA